MGGNSLKETEKNFKVVRINKKILYSTEKILQEKLKKYFINIPFAMPRFIEEKESFGDLDFLIGENDFNKEDFKEFLKKEFNTPEIFKHMNILSFAYPLKEKEFFQVDLIFVSKKEFLPMLHYLNDNDFSNLLGKLARNINLKYSMKGLYIPIEYNDLRYKKQDIFLTNNINEILDIFGLNKKQYEKGFKTYKEMFNYIISSKYFFKELFINKNENELSKNKKKDFQRPLYKLFIDYINNNNNINNIDNIDKNEFLNEILKKYNKTEEYYNIIKNIKEKIIFENNFNHNYIINYFKIKDKKKISNIMRKLKKEGLIEKIKKIVILSYYENKINKMNVKINTELDKFKNKFDINNIEL